MVVAKYYRIVGGRGTFGFSGHFLIFGSEFN